MALLLTLLVSMLLTIVMIPILISMAERLHMMDVPDERKNHDVPIPRCGGIAMAIGAFVPILYWYSGSPFILPFLVAGLIIVAFGMTDDSWDLSPRWKFLGQIIASLIIIYWGGVKIVSLGALLPEGVLLPLVISVPLTLLVLVGVTNAVNLSDGLDGLAGGISLLSICFIGYLAYVVGHLEIALAAVALVGAIFGFLRFNTYPAKIFMGDSGSQMLGFSAVTLALALTQQVPVISPLLPLLLFGLPVLDTLTVMTTRIINGKSPFSPDKRHFHHRLLEIGLTHAEAVLTIYVVQALMVLLSFILRFQTNWLILSVYIVFSLGILVFFHYAAARQQRHFSFLILVKTRFRAIRDKRRIQAVSFPCFKYLFYSLILVSSLLPTGLDLVSALLLMAVGCTIALTRWFLPDALSGVVRVVYYLFIPFAVYWGNYNMPLLVGIAGDRVLNGAFVLLLLVCTVLSLFSTRKKGIWSTPLDFLVLSLLLILPNLAGISVSGQRLGLVGLKCMVFIISFETLVTEMRGKIKGLTTVSAISFFVFALKSTLI
jgi:UDP-GlcNAc:undecaprenyl-phosphate/decaprenyl-phosphate GlcNAc-1-phosphate transferase